MERHADFGVKQGYRFGLKSLLTYVGLGAVTRLACSEGVFVGYRSYEQLEVEPQFHFGHGLSYTEFEYFNLAVPDSFSPSLDYTMRILMDVQNKGGVKGVRTMAGGWPRPPSSLWCWRRVRTPRTEYEGCVQSFSDILLASLV
ncbi:hypothetical protein ACJ41O_008882 [Fusarium nematophilum]